MRTNVARKQDNRGRTLEVEVVERKDTPGVWTVEAIDMAAEGDIFQALFVGPESHERALEYARFKYSFQ